MCAFEPAVLEAEAVGALLIRGDEQRMLGRTGRLETADEKALEARLLDQQRRQRVVRAGQHQRFFGFEQFAYGR
jgi:hypothetical protein